MKKDAEAVDDIVKSAMKDSKKGDVGGKVPPIQQEMKKVPPIPKKTADGKAAAKTVPAAAAKKASKEAANIAKKKVPAPRMSGGKIFLGFTMSMTAASVTIYQLEQQDILPPNMTSMVNKVQAEGI